MCPELCISEGGKILMCSIDCDWKEQMFHPPVCHGDVQTLTWSTACVFCSGHGLVSSLELRCFPVYFLCHIFNQSHPSTFSPMQGTAHYLEQLRACLDVTVFWLSVV